MALTYKKPSDYDRNVWSETATDSSVSPNAYTQGWDAITPPQYQFENFEQNRQDLFLSHINKYGIAAWDNATVYVKGSIVNHTDRIYISLDENSNKEPTTNTSDWKVIDDYIRPTVPTIAIGTVKYVGVIAGTSNALTLATPEQVLDGVGGMKKDSSNATFNDNTLLAARDFSNLPDRVTIANNLTVSEELKGYNITIGNIATTSSHVPFVVTANSGGNFELQKRADFEENLSERLAYKNLSNVTGNVNMNAEVTMTKIAATSGYISSGGLTVNGHASLGSVGSNSISTGASTTSSQPTVLVADSSTFLYRQNRDTFGQILTANITDNKQRYVITSDGSKLYKQTATRFLDVQGDVFVSTNSSRLFLIRADNNNRSPTHSLVNLGSTVLKGCHTFYVTVRIVSNNSRARQTGGCEISGGLKMFQYSGAGDDTNLVNEWVGEVKSIGNDQYLFASTVNGGGTYCEVWVSGGIRRNGI